MIITGASKGIGRELALMALSEGAYVTLHARTKEKLEEITNAFPKAQSLVLTGDITNQKDVEALITTSQQHWKGIDILVNNAGLSMRGRFIDLNPTVPSKVFNVNTLGSIHTTLCALPFLLESSGSVIFVNSISGVVGFPGASVYSASKMAVSAIAQAIDAELCHTGVHIGSVYLPYVENDPDKVFISADGDIKQHKRNATISQIQAATLIRQCIAKRKKRIIYGFLGKFAWFIQGVAPGIADFILRTTKGSIHSVQTKPAQ